jgi:chitinase
MSPRRCSASLIGLVALFGLCISCDVGNILCFCDAYTQGFEYVGHAFVGDVTSPQCGSFYSCLTGSYSSCPSGFSFSQKSQECLENKDGRFMGDCPAPLSGRLKPSNQSTLLYSRNVGPDGHQYVGYYESWKEEETDNPENTYLANFPAYVTQVVISFFKPGATYGGGVTFEGTGLSFSVPAQVIKDSISILKTRNPNTKVLLSVGGATYDDWTNLNAGAAAAFVAEFELDGIDIDFEPQGANCRAINGKISCSTDDLYISSVTSLWQALPAEKILTAAVYSVGAYGEGSYADAQPQGGYTGVSINMLESVGNLLNSINIMAYDAGVAFDPKLAYQAYSTYYSGPIQLGMQIPPESWGGHALTMAEATVLSMYVKDNGGSGMMLWALMKSGSPSAQEVSRDVCLIFDLPDCQAPLLSNSPAPPAPVDPSPSPPAPFDPVEPSSPPIEPSTSPPPPSPESPFPSPTPAPIPPISPICSYYSKVYFKTTSCSWKINKRMAYDGNKCKDNKVYLLRDKDLKKTQRTQFQILGQSNINMPITTSKRSKKCSTKYLKYTNKGARLSSKASSWRLVPVDGKCDRVMIYLPSKFRYMSTDETCSKFELTRGTGSVWSVERR